MSGFLNHSFYSSHLFFGIIAILLLTTYTLTMSNKAETAASKSLKQYIFNASVFAALIYLIINISSIFAGFNFEYFGFLFFIALAICCFALSLTDKNRKKHNSIGNKLSVSLFLTLIAFSVVMLTPIKDSAYLSLIVLTALIIVANASYFGLIDKKSRFSIILNDIVLTIVSAGPILSNLTNQEGPLVHIGESFITFICLVVIPTIIGELLIVLRK